MTIEKCTILIKNMVLRAVNLVNMFIKLFMMWSILKNIRKVYKFQNFVKSNERILSVIYIMKIQ